MIELKPGDLKIETFRPPNAPITAGANGVRITHVPTDIKVTVNKHRSYHQNRDTALRDLTLLLREVE